MYRVKAFALASCLGVAALVVPAKADQWNKKTILTVNESIQVPGKVLPPGKYVMKLMDSPSNRHIVQIFNGDETQLQTTVLAIPNYRLQPTGDTQFGWWETPAGQPRALRSWFYPGDNFGQEFAYPKSEATQIATVNKTAVPVTYAEKESELSTARVGSVDTAGNEQPLDRSTYSRESGMQPNTPAQQTEVAQNTTPAQTMPQATTQPAARTQDMSANTAQQTVPSQTMAQRTMARNTLPRTSSPFPLIGLAGLLSVSAAGALRLARRS